MSQTRAEEDETADLSLSALRRWQRALNVPISELLVESEGPLSEPIRKRANLVKLMKTARTIAQIGRSSRAMRLSERLIEQLTEIMPELKDVTSVFGREPDVFPNGTQIPAVKAVPQCDGKTLP